MGFGEWSMGCVDATLTSAASPDQDSFLQGWCLSSVLKDMEVSAERTGINSMPGGGDRGAKVNRYDTTWRSPGTTSS